MGAMAEAMMAYAQPLIDGTDGSLEQMNKALAISQACWNLAIFPAEQRRSAMDGLRKCFPLSDSEFEEFERTVLWPMIRRHEEMFPGLHQRRPIASPHWQTSPPRASTTNLLREDSPRENSTRENSLREYSTREYSTREYSTREKTSQPGRYDPCPCNSGKKFKFCCGRTHA